MNYPKVSIIVPVYNVEKYLSKCLNSLINQTLREIEILCVDDGSTDNSAKILENFVQKEQKRNEFLISRGWKIIRIISKKDKYINKNEFLTVFSHCLKKNFKLIKIFIDTKTLDIDGNVADIKDFVYNND